MGDPGLLDPGRQSRQWTLCEEMRSPASKGVGLDRMSHPYPPLVLTRVDCEVEDIALAMSSIGGWLVPLSAMLLDVLGPAMSAIFP